MLFSYLFFSASAAPTTGTVVGIDLGTTYSCVGVYRNGKVDIISNEAGHRITPSVVSYSDTERLVGDAAKLQITENPKNTIFAIKRLMGLQFSDQDVQNEVKRLPYKVVNKDNRPNVEVQFRKEKKLFAPEEISAFILSKMKSIAEEYLGTPVKNAVITVPAYFNDAQRKSTQDAGEIAGLNVVRVLNEPTAASLAYGLNKKGTMNILVFDLGGGTFDVSCLNVEDGIFEVLATGGDTHLGGEDFDDRTIEYLRASYAKKTGKDPKRNAKAMSKLKRAAENAKHALSTNLQTTIEIDNFMDGKSFEETLTRARFEELNRDLFSKCLDVVRAVLKDSALTIHEIDEVILVGGSTRIPKIQELIKSFFEGKEPSKEVNPDEAVAYGAAIQGALLSDGESPGQILLLNVNPMTLGLETQGGIMTPLIPRNTRVPTKKVKVFTTASDNQEQVRIHIFEGERAMAKDNHELGSFDLTGIKPAKRGVPQITVSFVIDANGMLFVTAEDKASKNSESVAIKAQETRLSEAQREAAAAIAMEMAQEDDNIRQCAIARSRFEHYLQDLSDFIKQGKSTLDGKIFTQISDIISEEYVWLGEHPLKNCLKDDFLEEFHKAKERIDFILPKDLSFSNSLTEDL